MTSASQTKTPGSLSKEIENLKFDKRLTEWHVNRGRISREELDRHLANLPDSASNVERFDLNTDGSEGEDSGSGF